jgi:hypothetical protein
LLGVTLLIVNPTTLLLVTVTDFGALVVLTVTLPNESPVGESVGAESVPVPVSAIMPGMLTVAFLALLVMLRLPVRVPVAVGVKVTPTVQLEPVIPVGCRMVEPARLQGFKPIGVVPKSPDAAMLKMVIATVLGFVSVAVLTVTLVWPTKLPGHARFGERLTNPASPFPLSVTNCGLLPASEGRVSVPITFPRAVAVKVTWTVHWVLAANGRLEHVSVVIWKFGDGPSTPVVVVNICPMLTGPAD